MLFQLLLSLFLWPLFATVIETVFPKKNKVEHWICCEARSSCIGYDGLFCRNDCDSIAVARRVNLHSGHVRAADCGSLLSVQRGSDGDVAVSWRLVETKQKSMAGFVGFSMMCTQLEPGLSFQFFQSRVFRLQHTPRQFCQFCPHPAITPKHRILAAHEHFKQNRRQVKRMLSSHVCVRPRD